MCCGAAVAASVGCQGPFHLPTRGAGMLTENTEQSGRAGSPWGCIL